VDRGRPALPPAGAAGRARRRRPHGVGRLRRPAHGPRGLVVLAAGRALRGRPRVELPRLVRHGARGLRRLVAVDPRTTRATAAATWRWPSSWTWIGEAVANVLFWKRPVVAARAGRRWACSPCPRSAPGWPRDEGRRGRRGAGGLACAARAAAAGHDVRVLERGPAPGGKAGRVTLAADGRVWQFDSGPSLLTMPWVFRELWAAVGLGDPGLVRVEPVTRYRWPTGPRSTSPPTCRRRSRPWRPGRRARAPTGRASSGSARACGAPRCRSSPARRPSRPRARGRASHARTRATWRGSSHGTPCARSPGRRCATRACAPWPSASPPTRGPTRAGRPRRSPSRATSSTPSGPGTGRAGSSSSCWTSSGGSASSGDASTTGSR
jgi:hypothetical protein